MLSSSWAVIFSYSHYWLTSVKLSMRGNAAEHGALGALLAAVLGHSGRDEKRRGSERSRAGSHSIEKSVAQGDHGNGSRCSRIDNLHDLALDFEAVFVDHVGSFLDPVDIARLAMTCTWDRGRVEASRCSRAPHRWKQTDARFSVTDRLFEQVCRKLGFRQTDSRSRPLPWALIFEQHLCVECWKPAVSTGSVHVDLNGGCGSVLQYTARTARKWVCGDCHRNVKSLRKSELKCKGLPRTAQRFGAWVRLKILDSLLH